VKPKPKTPEQIETFARRVAPGLFAPSEIKVPAQIREKWNALVAADENSKWSEMDFRLLILRCIEDGIHDEGSLLLKITGSTERWDKRGGTVCFVTSKLIEEGHITEKTVEAEESSGNGKMRVLELTTTGRMMLGKSA
jgi:hypothetical protein